MKYEKVSGQCVNFQKSAMLFSHNVRVDVRKDIHEITGMKIVGHLGKYLGLPSHFSRNKKSDLNFLKERMQKVVAGWKKTMFSIGGKEILLKAEAQAIPTYTMSCIRLPKGLCEDLSNIMEKFWWGSSTGSRKIHWMEWNKLCLPKANGGLGFRSLEGFNQALLAKQIWRLLCFPDSLVARVFRGKYFPNGHILHASIGSKPSFVWSSLIWGKELMCKGLRVRIGSGDSTYVFRDPWIPSDACFKAITPKDSDSPDIKVSEFILPGARWNISKLNQFMWEEDVAKITSIPLVA